MGFKDILKSQAILTLLNNLKKDKVIPGIVDKIEEISKAQLKGYSDRIELKVVEDVLLQICRELVNDSRESLCIYRVLLEREFEFVQGRIEAFEKEAKRTD